MNWQHILTAPKDGTQMLLSNGQTVQQGWWMHDEGGIVEKRDLSGRYIDQDERNGYIGWWDYGGGMQPEPTHWMPLPEAPEVEPMRLCPGCNGSGEQQYLSGGGPDAYDVTGPCATCGGQGAVGNILTAQTCPDCSPAPGAKVLTTEDMEALSLTHGLAGDVEEMAIIVETMVLDRLAAADASFEDRISDWAHGDALDAARYRWLRDNATRSGVNIDIGAGVEISATLDAAVDEAMRLTAAKESP